MLNPKLLAALTGTDTALFKAALKVLSALRGPDREDEALKATFTAPIRRWAMSREAYNLGGFIPGEYRIVAPLESAEQVLALHAKAYSNAYFHYHGHIRGALKAIGVLEGWEGAVFDEARRTFAQVGG